MPASPRRVIRALVVDDSAFMRSAISRMLQSEPSISVVGTGRTGAEAVRLAAELKPDVVTLDVEMPEMDGLEALSILMRESPVPVLMLSAHTTPGAEATLRALELGAADFLVKPGTDDGNEVGRMRDSLVARVLALACRNAGPRAPKAVAPTPLRVLPADGLRLVVVGASTGGPRALQTLLGDLPGGVPAAVLIVQHMPPLFTRQFARRLQDMGPLSVREAEHGAEVRPGEALLAPGHAHMEVVLVARDRAIVGLTSEPSAVPHRPSVDVLFRSAARLNGPRTLGLVLTGMGSDGCEGLGAIREAGGMTLAQDEQSSVVYGMPRACVEAGIVDRVVNLADAAGAVAEALGMGATACGRKAS